MFLREEIFTEDFVKFQEMIPVFLRLQNELNDLIIEGWREKNLNWHRAIRHELIECVDHIGWKWWSEKPMNLAAAKMEIIDVFHFWLSLIEGKDFYANAYSPTVCPKLTEETKEEVIAYLENLQNVFFSVSGTDKIHAGTFIPKAYEMFELMQVFDIDLEELTKTFVAKNTLNRFRNRNGYASGNYKKIWDGEEDNEWLTSIIRSRQFDWSNPDHAISTLYAALEHTYSTIRNFSHS